MENKRKKNLIIFISVFLTVAALGILYYKYFYYNYNYPSEVRMQKYKERVDNLKENNKR